LNTGFGRYTYIAFIEIYAARHVLEAAGICKRLPVLADLSLSLFELIAQFRRLLGIPPWIPAY
jgi:hypothetical protein